MSNKQLKSKQFRNKLAGKETSLSSGRGQFCKSNQKEVSKKIDYIRSHVEHFVLCLRDAFGFKDPMEVINSVSERLLKLFPIVPIEKIFKWFYGNSLGWCTNVCEDIVRQSYVDDLGFNSAVYSESVKIFGGRLASFLKKFFRRQSRHTLPSAGWKRRKSAFSKAQTFLMFKKGSPNVSEEMIEEANRKHKEAMSNSTKARSHMKVYKDTVISRDVVKNILFKYDDILIPEDTTFAFAGGWGDFEVDLGESYTLENKIKSQATSLISSLFKPGSFKRVMKGEKTLFPSSSAHSNKGASIHKGGATSIVAQHFTPVVGELDRMVYHPRTGVKTHYQVSYPDAPESIASELLEDKFNAVPVHLREPLKVRTITKGPSVPYWFLLPVQKFLWSTLLKHKIFGLIGEPIKPEILNEMLVHTNVGEKWLSGDYSAATDNLVKWLIEFVWSEICMRSGIPDAVYELGLKGLTGHNLLYKGNETVVQQNGQLMGSPLSFPILCLCNAIICILAFSKKRRKLNKLPLRINGDDCVMSYTDTERKRWKRYAEFIGMSPSPGKCYYATDWLQMNSELFILRNGSFRHINFINFSLASPYLAKGGEERTIESLSQTMQTFCINKSEKFIDIWMRRMAPFLKKKVPGLISWYLPQCLGGLGLMTSKLRGDLFHGNQLQVATQFFWNALEGKESPYKVSSVKGGLANFRNLKQAQKYTWYTPILDSEVKPVKSYWSERFFKQREEEARTVPLLWENLIRCDKVLLSDKLIKPVVNYQVQKVFRAAKKINPLPLKELLRLRGVDIHIPSSALESNYEPTKIFLDVLAIITQKDSQVLLM